MQYADDVKKIRGKIYIYGAGMVAKLLYNCLIGRDVEIVAFVVTEPSKNVEYLYGIPLISVNKIRKDYTVIIATLSNIHSEIESILTAYGISDYLAVSEGMFDIMRSGVVPYQNELASIKLRRSEMRKLYDGGNSDYLIVSNNEIVKQYGMQVMQPKEFLKFDGKTGTIYMLLIAWQENWKETINKAFCVAENVVLSFRYKYLNLENYSLIDEAKKHGYQLSGSNRFYRDEREYFTEDILLWFEKRMPQTLERDTLCEGCGLCEMICPVQAIHLLEDEYGYRKPKINKNLCINCGKCITKCPVYCIDRKMIIPKTFAYIGSDSIREHSSSGGVFGTIARFILAHNGYVCGAAWREDFQVEHTIIEKAEDLHKLQMSKYLRSDIRAVVPKIKSILAQNKKILFVGCPCQVAAVRGIAGEDENLLTIDLICAEAPSHWIFKQYLDENYDISTITDIEFRGKEDGWRPDSLCIKDVKGRKTIKHMEDISQKAFHSRMMMDVACEYCNFVKCSRVGDLSIGDAWGVVEHDENLDDKKGTSIILVNNKRGEELYQIASQYAKMTREIPFEWTYKNRTVNSIHPHVGRDRFYREIKEFGFNKAFEDVDKDRYDIGIVGNWSYPNYGSELTYFALYHTLKDMGYSVLMIEWAEDSYWKPYGCASLFEIEPYANDEIAQPSRNHYEMRRYNDKCRMFVLGSDQLLNPDLYHAFGENAILDWVDTDKKKIGYALSIGRTDIEYEPYDRREIAYYLKKFDDVSVREKTAVAQMRENFGITAEWVLDPVFLCERDWYEKIAKKYYKQEQTGIFAYILDLNEDIESALIKAAEEGREELCIFTDAAQKAAGNQWIDSVVSEHFPVERWLGKMIGSRFVVADSFHGICFAIIFHKDFVALRNNYRGGTRFDSILGLLGLEDRIIENADDLFKIGLLNKKIDFNEIEKKLVIEKGKSLTWLRDAIRRDCKKKYSDQELFFEERFQKFESRIFERMDYDGRVKCDKS